AARLVGRIEVHDHHQVGRGLVDDDADLAHVLGQSRLRDRDPVLHLHLRDVEIGAEIERHRDGEAAVGGRVRGHVEHVLDAIDLVFDRRPHGGRDDLRAGAGILAGNRDDRRRDFRVLRDRQAEERDGAEDHEHDRDDRGENRPVDEEVRDLHCGEPPQPYLLLACGPVAPGGGCGVTLPPGRARTMPWTMTRSSATRPDLITRRSSTTWPRVTYFCPTVLSSLTTSTYLRACSVPIAASGTSSAS